jgi:hypothetical protein
MSAYGNLVYWHGTPRDCAAVYLITMRLTTNGVPHFIATSLSQTTSHRILK